MSSELVTLLKQQSRIGPISVSRAAMRDAAARIEALEAEVARLREALGPFAAFAEFDATGTAYEGQGDDAAILFDHKTERQVTIGHLRAARRAREGGNADG